MRLGGLSRRPFSPDRCALACCARSSSRLINDCLVHQTFTGAAVPDKSLVESSSREHLSNPASEDAENCMDSLVTVANRSSSRDRKH